MQICLQLYFSKSPYKSASNGQDVSTVDNQVIFLIDIDLGSTRILLPDQGPVAPGLAVNDVAGRHLADVVSVDAVGERMQTPAEWNHTGTFPCNCNSL